MVVFLRICRVPSFILILLLLWRKCFIDVVTSRNKIMLLSVCCLAFRSVCLPAQNSFKHSKTELEKFCNDPKIATQLLMGLSHTIAIKFSVSRKMSQQRSAWITLADNMPVTLIRTLYVFSLSMAHENIAFLRKRLLSRKFWRFFFFFGLEKLGRCVVRKHTKTLFPCCFKFSQVKTLFPLPRLQRDEANFARYRLPSMLVCKILWATSFFLLFDVHIWLPYHYASYK